MAAVSVVIPTFNRPELLKLTVESVFAQSYANWELIIADDGSGESTKSYLQTLAGPNVHVLWLKHSGNPSQVRNAAIRAASGKYIAFLDSDDTWAPSKLENQVAALSAHPARRWSYTMCDHMDRHGHVLDNAHLASIAFQDGWVFEPLLKLEFSIAMPSVVAERELINEIGGFDEAQLFGEFQDICLRLALKSEVVALRLPLCKVRNHDDHYSGDRVRAHAGWMRLYQKMAALAPSVELQRYCVRMLSDESLRLARMLAEHHKYWAMFKTLTRAGGYSWRYRQWWTGAFKCVVRPAIPRSLKSLIRPKTP